MYTRSRDIMRVIAAAPHEVKRTFVVYIRDCYGMIALLQLLFKL